MSDFPSLKRSTDAHVGHKTLQGRAYQPDEVEPQNFVSSMKEVIDSNNENGPVARPPLDARAVVQTHQRKGQLPTPHVQLVVA